MGTTAFKGNSIQTSGDLPISGSAAPEISLLRGDLSKVSLASYEGKKKVLNIFPSIDTGVCAASVKAFNEKVAGLSDVVILHVSLDLPFAQGRFCLAEGIKDSEALSAFRSSFARDYGVEILEGPLKGLCARAVVVVDEDNSVIYSNLVPEITQEPNYEKVFEALKGSAAQN